MAESRPKLQQSTGKLFRRHAERVSKRHCSSGLVRRLDSATVREEALEVLVTGREAARTFNELFDLKPTTKAGLTLHAIIVARVSNVSNLLYRGLPVGHASEL